MRCYDPSTDQSPGVRKVVSLPEIGLVNGVTVLSIADSTVLVADSGKGAVVRVDVNTGASETVIHDPIFLPGTGGGFSTGVNGLRVVNGSELYFTSTTQGIVGTVPIGSSGQPTGQLHVIANVSNADDFDIGRDGSLWVAQNRNNTLARVWPNGTVETVLGAQDSDVLAGPVSARFARGRGEGKGLLYISTDGLFKGESDGKIVSIQTEADCVQ